MIFSPPSSGRYGSISGPYYSSQRSHNSTGSDSGRVSPESMNRIIRETTDGLQSLSVGASGGGIPTSAITSPTRRVSADPSFTANDYTYATNGNTGVLRTVQPNNFLNSQPTSLQPPNIIPSNVNQSYASLQGTTASNDPILQSTYGLRTNKALLNTLVNYDPGDEMPPEDIMSEILQELSNHNERYEQRKTCMLKLIKLLRDGVISNWDEYFKPTLLILLETLGDDGNSSTEELITSSGVRQCCPLSPFLFNFVVDVLLEMTLSSSKFPGVELLPGGSLVDLEYADDIVLFGEDADKMQSLQTTLSNNASMFGMRFSPSKCKMLLQDWVTSTPELVIGSEVVECVDRFTYLESLISPCGPVCDEISARIQKARLAFANLRHLWRRRDIRLSTKGRVYCAAVRPVLLYG
ncbi:unnamed protein product, partial [Schistosoma margrebowiei]